MSRLVVGTAIKKLVALLRTDEAAELIEFAVSVPLLVVFMVGIFDFSSAFILKQKIAHVAAEAARVAANQPMNDVANTGSCPVSICAIRDVVKNALTNNGITDCGLASATAINTPGTLSWTFTGPDPNCSLTIDRGYHYDLSTLPDPPFLANYRIEATKVTLSYPYQWSFNRVITLVVPSANYANNPIQSVAVMQNLN